MPTFRKIRRAFSAISTNTTTTPTGGAPEISTQHEHPLNHHPPISEATRTTAPKIPTKKASLVSIRRRRSKSLTATTDERAEGLLNSSDIIKNEEGVARPDTATGERTNSLKSMGDVHTLQSSSIISCPSTAQSRSPGVEHPPQLVIQHPTPSSPPTDNLLLKNQDTSRNVGTTLKESRVPLADDNSSVSRRESWGTHTEQDVIKALLEEDPDPPPIPARSPSERHVLGGFTRAIDTSMSRRKVWVKRPGSAATILLIKEDDLVDDAKDIILRKYANSLGRHYDAPDLTIRIVSRGQPGERILSPDEPFCGTIDSYYPGGQGMDEALLIDIPVKRTPRPSPGRGQPNAYQNYYQQEEVRPHESGTEYFPPMPPPPTAAAAAAMPSPLPTANSHDGRQSHAAHERAMSVLATGQVPALPSPGGARRMHTSKQHRPLNARHNTSSPTTIANNIASRSNRPRLDSTASNDKHAVIPIVPQPLPTPDNPEATVAPSKTALSNPPTPRIASPRPRQGRKTRQKQVPDGPSLPPGLTLLDTSMPPINVLIVEDNMINMKLLEQFVRRLGVRWHTAVNGREAVQRWRKGGFHLVLMDIQLPIMSGLEATKEIRRLERVNNIGVFSSSSASEAAPDLDVAPNEAEAISKVEDEDKLGDVGRLFKSPVIIVALTASNLQSDRHEALAAGCNDFLTKPVNFVWFERKVKEWGCMQALIDFDGWRKWEDFATENGLKDPRDIKTGPKASASKRAAPRDVKPPSSNLPVMNVKNSTTTNLPVPPKSAVAAETTSTQDFANTGTTLPPPKKKSFGDGVAEEEGRLVKEGSEDTVVGVAAGGA